MAAGQKRIIFAEQVAKAQAAQAARAARAAQAAQAAPKQKPNIFAEQVAKAQAAQAEQEAQARQAGQAGQAGQPGQPGQSKDIDEAEGPPYGQYGRYEEVPDPWPPYFPEWTHPEWSSDFEYNLSGKKRRRIYIQTGQILRPAILPIDAAKNPTDFARRFGIYPKDDPPEQNPPVGRSLISPRIIPREPTADPEAFESKWAEEESWQSYVFEGPTTQEMIASGAYIPSHRFSEPTIEGDLHPFLSRDKWVNLGSDIFKDFVPDVRWKFGDQEGTYHFGDDRVWAVMQPALRLVGRVLNSNHPFWNAILSFYHLRPVPADVDGRTDAAKQEDGAPLQALWLDENKPGMYPAAAELRRLGFRSRDTTLAMLNQYLRFTIGTWNQTTSQSGRFYASTTRLPNAPLGKAAFSREQPEPRIIIVVEPIILWPLLTSEFPEAHTAVTFGLAVAILHEMAHACRFAHEFLVREPQVTLNTLQAVRELGITEDMAALFRPLGVQMYGTQGWLHDLFFEEGPQSEDGKAFEDQLWGDCLFLGPLVKTPIGSTILRPYILACSWPWGHRASGLQHQQVDRSLYAPYARGSYVGFLLNPPAPVYDQIRPVEVESYARFFQEAWWQGHFQRFGHQALRFNPPFNALMVMPSEESRFMDVELKRVLDPIDFNYIKREAIPQLYGLKQLFLAQYLLHETEELVIGQATIIRLKYEARTWERTYAKIDTQVDKSLADLGEFGHAIEGWLADEVAGRIAADAQAAIMTSFNQAATTIVTDDLMVLGRHLRYSIQYAQALIAMYSLLPKENDRRIVHQQYMTLLRNHLNSIREKLGTLTQRLDGFATAASLVDSQSFLAALLQGLAAYIVDFLRVSSVINAGLRHVIELLADELIAPGFDYTRHPETLPAVPEARKRLSMAASLKKAACRPLLHLKRPEANLVRNIVNRWRTILILARSEQENLDREGDAAIP